MEDQEPKCQLQSEYKVGVYFLFLLMKQHLWTESEKISVITGFNEFFHDWEGIKNHYLPHLSISQIKFKYYYLRKLQTEPSVDFIKDFVLTKKDSMKNTIINDDNIIDRVRQILLQME